MPVKIRLQRKGRRKLPYYHIVVADNRAPRDGRFIEKIGAYNPMTKPATIEIDTDRALDWLQKGAQPTDTARAILRFRGVLYKKHLLRGVAKGALSQEEADRKFADFLSDKDKRISQRFEQTAQEERDRMTAISGVAKTKEVVEEVAEEATDEATAETSETEGDQTEVEAPAEVENAVEATEEAAAEEVEEAGEIASEEE